MSDPKRLRIVKAVQTRLAAIDGNGLYHTNLGHLVRRGKPNFSPDELPACAVYGSDSTAETEQGERAKVLAQVYIEAHALIGNDHGEDVACRLLADIARAMELTGDERMGGLLQDRLSWESDEIIYPEESDTTVSVRVTYNIPHVRHYGDPDN